MNAALISTLTNREVAASPLEKEVAVESLKAVTRRQPLISQLKRRAADVLEKQRKEKEEKSA